MSKTKEAKEVPIAVGDRVECVDDGSMRAWGWVGKTGTVRGLAPSRSDGQCLSVEFDDLHGRAEIHVGHLKKTGDPTRGWGQPAISKKAHYFLCGRSLCGKWAFAGHLEQGNDKSPDNCMACRRRLEKERSIYESDRRDSETPVPRAAPR